MIQMLSRWTVSSFLKAGKVSASTTVCDTLFHNQIIQGESGGLYINFPTRGEAWHHNSHGELKDPKWLPKLYRKNQDWLICMENQQ